MALDPRWEANTKVSQAASGSANELVPALADIIKSGYWREFVHPMQGLKHYDRFADYCDDFLHLSPEAVEALLDRSNFEADALEVRRLIRVGIDPDLIGDNGGRREKGQSRDTKLTEQDNATYVVARLKRDHPDLAQQVIDGQITPNAAAIKAGIRKPRATFRTDDIDAAIASLLKHYTHIQLIAALHREETR